MKVEQEMLDYGQFFKRTMDSAYTSIANIYNLTNNEVAIISFLANSKDKDTASDIVNELYFTKSHVSLSIDDLAKKDYIVRELDKNEKKIIHLKLTKNAEEITKKLKDKKEELKNQFFKEFNEEEIKEFMNYLTRIINNVKNNE